MNRAGTIAGPNPAAKPATGECERFYADLERAHLAPLWRLDTVQPEPRSPVQPYLWKWREFYPHLLRAGDVMQLAETQAGEAPERRVLLFVNPGISTLKAATETLSVGVQLIFPGEVAPAHRHQPCFTRGKRRGISVNCG